jgi:hypothetical protein
MVTIPAWRLALMALLLPTRSGAGNGVAAIVPNGIR